MGISPHLIILLCTRGVRVPESPVPDSRAGFLAPAHPCSALHEASYTAVSESKTRNSSFDYSVQFQHIRNFLYFINVMVTVLLCIAMDAITVFFLSKRKKAFNTPQFKTEIRLFFVSAAMLITHLFYASIMVSLLYFYQEKFKFKSLHLPLFF